MSSSDLPTSQVIASGEDFLVRADFQRHIGARVFSYLVRLAQEAPIKTFRGDLFHDAFTLHEALGDWFDRPTGRLEFFWSVDDSGTEFRERADHLTRENKYRVHVRKEARGWGIAITVTIDQL